jgi:hypothetical protein
MGTTRPGGLRVAHTSPVRRSLSVPAAVCVWIAAVLLLDAGSGIWFQRLLGLATWALLLALLRGERRSTRLQVAAVVVAATMLEYTASPLLGLYTYRLHNVPAFVPPGHGLVYLAALTTGRAVAGRGLQRPFVLTALGLGALWALWGLLVSARPDTAGAGLFCCLAAFLLRGRQPAVYAAAFFVTAYLELAGTSIGTWAWAHHDPLGIWSLGNPPSGIAGGYGWLDMIGMAAAMRFAGSHPVRELAYATA